MAHQYHLADLFETVTRLSVTVQPLYGGAHSGDMVLTHFKPPGEGPFPAVVMQHGRGVEEISRDDLAAARMQTAYARSLFDASADRMLG